MQELLMLLVFLAGIRKMNYSRIWFLCTLQAQKTLFHALHEYDSIILYVSKRLVLEEDLVGARVVKLA